MDSRIGTSRSAASASAAGDHSCQCTGLSACWRRYGDVESTSLFTCSSVSRRLGGRRILGLPGTTREGGAAMSTDMIAPSWMHSQISAEQYDSWSEEQCAGIEIVDGMVVMSPSASKRHNRLARILANALDAASGPEWNADTDFDVRLQDVPLTNRRPDVIVYRAETIDVSPTRPENVLLVVEVVSPGSETTDRVVKADQYANARIPFYWRVEQAFAESPIVYTYVLDPATNTYREGDVFTGTVSAVAPFPVSIDLVG